MCCQNSQNYSVFFGFMVFDLLDKERNLKIGGVKKFGDFSNGSIFWDTHYTSTPWKSDRIILAYGSKAVPELFPCVFFRHIDLNALHKLELRRFSNLYHFNIIP